MAGAVNLDQIHKRKHLKEMIYEVLRARILTGELKPGEKLLIESLSVELRTSRSPLKEAINQLHTEGLVDVLPQNGTFVAKADAQQIAENFAVRNCMEQFAIEILVRDLSAAQEQELRVWLRGPSTEIAANTTAMKAFDLDFHRHIVAASKNRELCRIYNVLSSKIMLVMSSPTRPIRDAPWLEQHRPIIESILDRDLDRAKEALREHLEEACDKLTRAQTVVSD